MGDERHLLDLIPAYALGCLDEGEKAEVAQHLESCESCRQDLFAYQRQADQLPLAMAQTSPPPRLKQNLMQKIVKSKPTMKAENKLSFWHGFSTVLQRRLPALAAASLVVVLLLVTSNLLLWRQVKQSKQIQMPLIGLHGTDFAPLASGTIVTSQDGTHGALVVDLLKPLEGQQQYQLWLIKDGVRTSGGVFSVDESGYATIYVESQQPLSSYDSFGITIEPAGGSPGPTGIKVMGG